MLLEMLHHVTFDEKWENWPILVISYKLIWGTNIFLTRYDNLHFQKFFFFNFPTPPPNNCLPLFFFIMLL